MKKNKILICLMTLSCLIFATTHELFNEKNIEKKKKNLLKLIIFKHIKLKILNSLHLMKIKKTNFSLSAQTIRM
jgi:hypothetical protein